MVPASPAHSPVLPDLLLPVRGLVSCVRLQASLERRAHWVPPGGCGGRADGEYNELWKNKTFSHHGSVLLPTTLEWKC